RWVRRDTAHFPMSPRHSLPGCRAMCSKHAGQSSPSLDLPALLSEVVQSKFGCPRPPSHPALRATFSHEGRREASGSSAPVHPSPLVGLRGGGAATNRPGGAIGAEEGTGVRGARSVTEPCITRFS